VLKKQSKIDFALFFTIAYCSLLAVYLNLFSISIFRSSLNPFSRPSTYLTEPGSTPASQTYSLEPMPSGNIELPVSPASPILLYKVAALLKNDQGQTVVDQSNFTYTWQTPDPSIVKVSEFTQNMDCPYGVKSPCPNFQANFQGLKEGVTTVNVAVYYKVGIGLPLTETQFQVTVTPRTDDSTVKLKVKFQGVNTRPADDTAQDLKIYGANLNQDYCQTQYREFTTTASALVDDTGIYTVSFNLNSGYFNKPGYKICLKGPKQLQACFSDLTFISGQLIDLTDKPLESGDLPLPQNNQVDNQDFSYLWDHMGSFDPTTISTGDLNLDGALNTGDINLLLETLSVKYDENGW
jgi:hypothetical protein